MLRSIRKLFGTTPRRVLPVKRLPFKPQLEQLEDRDCPAMITVWTDGAGTGLSNNGSNWSNGLPNSIKQAIFDPKASGTGWHGSNDSITWTGTNNFCNGIVVQNGYSGTMTVATAATVDTNANFSVDGTSGFTLNGNKNPIMLLDHAAVTVAAGGWLTLNNNGIQSGVYFFKGDGNTGEVLNNSGTVSYNAPPATGNNDIEDYLQIPVLNNGGFYLAGGNDGTRSFYGVLNVTASDALTNNVSWYQNSSSAFTSMSGGVGLALQSGYTQTAGILKTTDNLTESLTVQNSSGYGTVNINGGKVQVDPDATTYGTFEIWAKTVNLQGELDLKVSGSLTSRDTLNLSQVGGETLNCQAGSSLVLTINGTLQKNSTPLTIVEADTINNPGDDTLNTSNNGGTTVVVGASTITVSNP